MLSERQKALQQYIDLLAEARDKGKLMSMLRALAVKDLYFLLVRVLRQGHMNEGPEYRRDWLFDRCREVQAEPDNCLDLWAREHFKSTIITFGLSIQDTLNDPEITIGIFSYNRPTAKAFLTQIKREFETNDLLKKLFPEILWQNPTRDAPKWSENDGIIVKRKSNPKEATVEAWGLVDGQPTSKHYQLMVYDDIITRDSVTTPDMIRKVTEGWELSMNLMREGGRQRYVGTHYHAADTYQTIKERGIVQARLHPGTKDGTALGEPVLFTKEYMALKRQSMSNYVFSCQILLNPKADSVVGFDRDWLRYWPARNFNNLNIYVIVDPASSKKRKENDYTVMMVIGLGRDNNYYWIDGLRDRLNLKEKAARLFHFHRIYRPLAIGYEEYGLQADIEYIEEVQDRENYHFAITPLGGRVAKDDRIARLEPICQASRLYVPEKLVRVNYEGTAEDLIQVFIHEEFTPWPYALHDDMLDTLARITDPDLMAVFPEPEGMYPPGHDERANDWDPLRYH